MRVAMMGSGGIGGYFGGRMAANGEDVTFIARGRHLNAIRADGLQIVSRDRGDAMIRPAQATDNPEEVGVVDYIVVGVKLGDTEEAARAILPMVGPDTTVVSLQNGVESDDILSDIVGKDHVIGGVAFIASAIEKPGIIRHIGTLHRIVIGEREGGASARCRTLQKMLTDAGTDAEISDDINRTIWEKFVFLVGLSATTTLMRRPIGPIRDDPDSRQFLHDIMAETVAVGRAKGIDLPADFAESRMAFTDGLPADMTSSMHHDLEGGKPLELAWLSGAVVRFGRELGIPTPVNQAVFAILKQHSAPGP